LKSLPLREFTGLLDFYAKELVDRLRIFKLSKILPSEKNAFGNPSESPEKLPGQDE
jgi:hypothetical protein